MSEYQSKKWVLFVESPTSLLKREFVKQAYFYSHKITDLGISQLLIIGSEDKNSIFVKRKEDENNFKIAKRYYQKKQINKQFSNFRKVIQKFIGLKGNSFEKALIIWQKVLPIVVYTYYIERILMARYQRIEEMSQQERVRLEKLIKENGDLREKIAKLGYPAYDQAYRFLKNKYKKLKNIDYLSLEEIVGKKMFDPKEVERRKNFYVEVTSINKTDIYTGQNADKLLGQELFKKTKFVPATKELKGFVAFPGKVVGRVALVNKISDFKKDYAGKVLVSFRTVIEYTHYLKKVKAIITDIGGINSHAAIVAREFKIPTIVGTEIGTKVLKEGDLVEVDAERGIVRRL